MTLQRMKGTVIQETSLASSWERFLGPTVKNDDTTMVACSLKLYPGKNSRRIQCDGGLNGFLLTEGNILTDNNICTFINLI